MNQLDRENAKGGACKGKFEMLVANLIEKSRFLQKNVLPEVPCGHFAPGTLSETCFKDVVVEVHVRQHKLTKMRKIQRCQI